MPCDVVVIVRAGRDLELCGAVGVVTIGAGLAGVNPQVIGAATVSRVVTLPVRGRAERGRGPDRVLIVTRPSRRACTGVRRVASRFEPSRVTPRHTTLEFSVTQEPTIADNTYNAAHLLVLEGLEAVRKRPGMYIGSTDTRGLMHCLWEIIDNGVDEALAGAAHRVEVTLHPDGSAEVHDDGRGIPTDKEPKTGLPGVEVVATKLHAGGKFGGGSYVATGGLHGVGLSVVNALSARMDIDVDRSPASQGISFRHGAPGVFDGEGPDAAFTEQSGMTRKGKRVAKSASGTRIRFWPDRRIFTKDATFELDGLVGRARQTSFIVPGLELVIRDLRGETPTEEKFRHDGGIAEFTDFLAKDEPVTEVLRIQGSGSFTETVPMLDAQGHMTPQDVDRELGVDIAVRWGTGYDTELRSFVNVIATPKGGTHVAGFEAALVKPFNEAMRAAKVLKVNDPDVEKSDILEGMTAVVTVRQAEPQFEGQTKEILGTPAVRSEVRKIVAPALHRVPDLDQGRRQAPVATADGQGLRRRPHPHRRAPAQGDPAPQERPGVLVAALQAGRLPRSRQRPHRAVHRRGRLRARHRQARPQLGVPGAAADPRQDPQRPEGLGRRHAQERRVRLDHPGRRRRLGAHLRPRRRPLRPDHLHGRRRLRRRPHPLPAGHAVLQVHARADHRRARLHRRPAAAPHRDLQPPQGPGQVRLHLLRRRAAAQARRAEEEERKWKDPVQRYKGLGEMDADQLAETTMDPRRRTLRKLTVDDADVAASVFELLMGSDVAPRKEFIVQGAYEVDVEAARRLRRDQRRGAWSATWSSRSLYVAASRVADPPDGVVAPLVFLWVPLFTHRGRRAGRDGPVVAAARRPVTGPLPASQATGRGVVLGVSQTRGRRS